MVTNDCVVAFELLSHRDAVVVRVYTTSTADVVYNQPPEEISESPAHLSLSLSGSSIVLTDLM